MLKENRKKVTTHREPVMLLPSGDLFFFFFQIRGRPFNFRGWGEISGYTFFLFVSLQEFCSSKRVSPTFWKNEFTFTNCMYVYVVAVHVAVIVVQEHM